MIDSFNWRYLYHKLLRESIIWIGSLHKKLCQDFHWEQNSKIFALVVDLTQIVLSQEPLVIRSFRVGNSLYTYWTIGWRILVQIGPLYPQLLQFYWDFFWLIVVIQDCPLFDIKIPSIISSFELIQGKTTGNCLKYTLIHPPSKFQPNRPVGSQVTAIFVGQDCIKCFARKARFLADKLLLLDSLEFIVDHNNFKKAPTTR